MDRDRPPKMKDEPYAPGVKQWITHNLWCKYRKHRRSSVLCPRCLEVDGCQMRASHEYMLRRERHRFFRASWGVQRRLLPEEAMVPDLKE
jgi:hypothetical protein